ncbi:MAG: ABC transporter ATP-binding protein [Peptostreptococcaceae bacterium]
MELLKIENIEKIYHLKNKEIISAVNGVNLKVQSGKCIGLVGESGCGKTTLGKMIVGLEKSTQGNIFFKKVHINDINKNHNFRKEIQMVFQDSLAALNRKSTIFESISEPLKNFYKFNKTDLISKVDELLDKVGIDKIDKYKYPHQFSGGQLQRICIARSLASNPSLLVLDEPLSSLDVSVQAQILNLLSDLKNDLHLTYIMISHDLEAVYYLSDSIVVMYRGRIMEQIDDINDFYNMTHPYTKKLLSSSHEYRVKTNEYILEEANSDSINPNGCLYFDRCTKRIDKCKLEIPPLIEIAQGHKIACHCI